MDYSMHHQWRDQLYPSDQPQPSAKIPKLIQEHQLLSGPALSLSVLEPNSTKSLCNLSTLQDSTAPRYPKGVGGYFSLAQWQELELQALIFKYMLAGASVPMDLVLLIKKSLLNSPAFHYHLHHHRQYQHFQPTMLQAGYWGRTVVDAEPGRCRRTDGKKWRCSRDVVTGQKYCERHMHRGRNRSRKPVEIPTPNVTGGLNSGITASSLRATKETHFAFSGPPPSTTPNDLFHLNQRSSDCKTESRSYLQSHHHNIVDDGAPSDGQVLRHFFDDWPRSQQDSGRATSSSASPATSSTHLSISIPGNPSSDFSLKLSTGNADETGPSGSSTEERQANWMAGWGAHPEASMGGPLAEALRSSTSTSPTSVLHKSYGSQSEASSICT